MPPHLGYHLPTGDGGLAIVAGFELQRDGAWADVGDGHVGGRAGQLCEETGGGSGGKVLK